MNNPSRNKLLTWMVAILMLANLATIGMFWFSTMRPPGSRKGSPAAFLVKELNLDAQQEEKLDVLRKEHFAAAQVIRKQIRDEKDAFFSLLKKQGVTDSMKTTAAKSISIQTEKLDLLTLNHFQQVRAICTPEQQIRFDRIIDEVIDMINAPRGPMGPGNSLEGPPPGGPRGNDPAREDHGNGPPPAKQ